jgi:hypothetical protein
MDATAPSNNVFVFMMNPQDHIQQCCTTDFARSWLQLLRHQFKALQLEVLSRGGHNVT